MTDLDEVIKVLNNGGVAVIPTDTIYGVVVQARNKTAIANLYDAKGRAADKACITLIADFEQLADFGINTKWLHEAKKYWPGSNSLIFPASNNYEYLTQDGTICLRLPDSDELRHLIRQTGPLIAPSANPEGLPPAITIAQAKEYFGDKVDIYVDAGELANPPSTLIDLVNHQTLR